MGNTHLSVFVRTQEPSMDGKLFLYRMMLQKRDGNSYKSRKLCKKLGVFLIRY